MTGPVRRRDVLAVAGASALAGCGGLARLFRDDGPTLGGQQVAAVPDDAPPSVPERVPLSVPGSALADRRERVRSLLDAVPDPLTADHVPNGAVRAVLRDHRRSAENSLTASAPTDAAALARLRAARGDARALAAAWEYVQGETDRDGLVTAADDLATRAETARDRLSYAGGAPARTALIYGHAERLLDDGEDHLTTSPPDRWTAVGVADFAGTVERGAAALADARGLDTWYRAALADPEAKRPTLVAAASDLGATVADLRTDLSDVDPSEPGALVDGSTDLPAVEAVGTLYHQVTDGRDRLPPGEVPARAVLTATRTLARHRALGRLRDRVDSGDAVAVEAVEDVATLRRRAVEALSAALRGDEADLSRWVVRGLGEAVARADERLGRLGETARINGLRNPLGLYVYVTAVAGTAPEAAATAREVLGSA
ncbi:MAG: hypothetical protein ABEJ08_03700 [Halobacteriaceae archaeon]